jgi:hypothetical protein
MSFWKLVKGINFKQIASLGAFLLQHPIFMFATVKATSQTMRIVQEEFPDIHGKDNKANAFRHALWNFLIAFQCAKNEKDIAKVISWTKKITDWHEDFSPNIALARAMDLHNNHIGRTLFSNLKINFEKEIIKELKSKLDRAVQVGLLNDLDQNLSELVFIHHD